MTPVAGVRRRSLVFYVATTDLMGSSGADEFSSADEDEADLTEGAVETASWYFKATGRDVEVPELSLIHI